MSTEQVLAELKRQVVNLDVNKYKVLLIWDPVSSKDVGWLTVKKDVEVNLSKFQGRDVNLRALAGIRTVPTPSLEGIRTVPTPSLEGIRTVPSPSLENIRTVPSHSRDGIRTVPAFSPSPSSMIASSYQTTGQSSVDSSIRGSTKRLDVSQEVIDISNDSTEYVPDCENIDFNENITSIKTESVNPLSGQNPLSNSVSSSKTLPLKPRFDEKQKINQGRSDFKRQCPQCFVQINRKSLLNHLRFVHNLQPEKEQVTCDECGISVFKINLEYHKSVAHSVKKESKPKCVKKFECSCGKKYSTAAGLSQHKLRFCGKPLTNIGGLIKANELRRQERKKLADEELVKSSQESNGDNGDHTAREASLNISVQRKEKVKFEITYQDRSYNCSRSKDRTIKASLIKFCKDIIGKELRFEFHGEPLTGTEVTQVFDGGVIIASDRD